MRLELATISRALPGYTVTMKNGKIIVHAKSGRSEMRIEIPESALDLSLEEFGDKWLKPAFIAMGGLEVSNEISCSGSKGGRSRPGGRMKDSDIIATGWAAGGFGIPGMATIFRLDGKAYAAPGVSDYARKSLTVKEARHLVNAGKAVPYTVPHL
jgi:hypothetical protein